MSEAASTETNASRAADYPLRSDHDAFEVAVRKLKGRPRHCAINAIRSLRRAWQIAPIDPEMAAFRAITAEEEAATALIFALQKRRYPRADELNWRQHPHKAGITPFLRAIESMIAESPLPRPSVVLKHNEDPPRIDIFFDGAALGIPGDLTVSPEEPLHGVLSHGNAESGPEIATFTDQLQALADDRGAKDILAVIRADANLRNQVLYAADDGIPDVQNVDAFLLGHRRPVFILLALTIIILQTKQIQLFAVQALHAYLLALGKAAQEFDYQTAAGPPSDLSIKIVSTPDGPPVATVEQRFDNVVLYSNNEPEPAPGDAS